MASTGSGTVTNVAVKISADIKQLQNKLYEAQKQFDIFVQNNITPPPAATLGERFLSGVKTAAATAKKTLASVYDYASKAAVFFTPFSSVFSAAKMGLLAVEMGIASATIQAVKFAAALEDAQISFSVLSGSKEAGKAMVSQLQKFSLATPFSFEKVLPSAMQAKAFGIEDKDLIPTLRVLGDVSAALNQPIQDIVYLYGTLKTQNRAFAIDIRQFAMRGIPIYEELAKVLRKDTTEVMKLVEEGKVGFAEVQKAFANMTGVGGRFYDMMEQRSRSLSGRFMALKDLYQIFSTKLGGEVSDKLGIKPIITNIVDYLSDVEDRWKDVSSLIEGFTSGVKNIVLYIWDMAKMFAALGRAVFEIATTVVQMFNIKGYSVGINYQNTVLKWIDFLIGVIKMTVRGFSFFLTPITAIVDVLHSIVKSFTSLVKIIVHIIESIAKLKAPDLNYMGQQVKAVVNPELTRYMWSSIDVLNDIRDNTKEMTRNRFEEQKQREKAREKFLDNIAVDAIYGQLFQGAKRLDVDYADATSIQKRFDESIFEDFKNARGASLEAYAKGLKINQKFILDDGMPWLFGGVDPDTYIQQLENRIAKQVNQIKTLQKQRDANPALDLDVDFNKRLNAEKRSLENYKKSREALESKLRVQQALTALAKGDLKNFDPSAFTAEQFRNYFDQKSLINTPFYETQIKPALEVAKLLQDVKQLQNRDEVDRAVYMEELIKTQGKEYADRVLVAEKAYKERRFKINELEIVPTISAAAQGFVDEIKKEMETADPFKVFQDKLGYLQEGKRFGKLNELQYSTGLMKAFEELRSKTDMEKKMATAIDYGSAEAVSIENQIKAFGAEATDYNRMVLEIMQDQKRIQEEQLKKLDQITRSGIDIRYRKYSMLGVEFSLSDIGP